MSTKINVAQNAVILMATQAITWVLALILTIFLPRYLGPTAIGQYHFSNSIWAVLSILASLGMDTYLTKEAARKPEQVPSLLWNSAILRFFLFLICVVGLKLYLQAFHYPVDTQNVALVIGISSLGWMLISVVQSVLVGFEKMKYVSYGNIAGKLTGTVVSITLLLLGQKVLVIAAVNTLSALVTLIIEFIFLKKIISIPVKINLSGISHLAKGGIPYLLSGLFLTLYLQIDFIVISLLVDERTVGYYGSAYTLFGTLLFIPTVLMTAIFPVLSRMYINDPDGLPRVTRKSFDLLVFMGMPIGLGVVACARPTVLLLYGVQFAPAAPILSLFGSVIFLTYVNVFIGQFLISVDRQNQWTLVMVVATLVTIPLDIWLIPWCVKMFSNGGIGGALSFIITEGGMLIAGLILIPKGILLRSNLWYTIRSLFAGIIMIAAVWWIRSLQIPDYLQILFIVSIGGFTFLFVAWVFKLISQEDIKLLKDLSSGILSKFNKRKVPDETQAS